MAESHDCTSIAQAEIRLFRSALINSLQDEIDKLSKELKDLIDARNGFVGGFTKKLSKANIFTQNEIRIRDLEIKIDHLKTIQTKISDSSKYYP